MNSKSILVITVRILLIFVLVYSLRIISLSDFGVFFLDSWIRSVYYSFTESFLELGLICVYFNSILLVVIHFVVFYLKKKHSYKFDLVYRIILIICSTLNFLLLILILWFSGSKFIPME